MSGRVLENLKAGNISLCVALFAPFGKYKIGRNEASPFKSNGLFAMIPTEPAGKANRLPAAVSCDLPGEGDQPGRSPVG